MKNIITYLYSKTENYLLDEIKDKYSFLLFQKGVYLFLILYTFYLLPIAPQLYGSNSLFPAIKMNISFIYKPINLLQYSNINKFYYLFIVSQLFFLIFGIIISKFRLISILIYFITVNLFNKTYLMNTGAQQLLSLMLIFMILINIDYKSKKSHFRQINNALSNIGIIACKIQIIVLYLFSAFYKYLGVYWVKGEALFFALKIEDYCPIWLTGNLTSNNFLLQVGTYITLIYLTFFPLLIWLKRIKLKFLLLGVFLHLTISFFMGIVDLGLVMIISYLIFIPNDLAFSILNKSKLIPIKKGRLIGLFCI